MVRYDRWYCDADFYLAVGHISHGLESRGKSRTIYP